MTMIENLFNNPRSTRPLRLRTIVLMISGMMITPLPAAETRVALIGHIPKQIQNAALIEKAPADEQMQLSLAVRLDQALLDQTMEQLYGRNAPARKHFLSSSEFAQKFGMADKRQMLRDFAQANGLTVDPAEDKPESMVVKVSGSVDTVQKVFSIPLNHYRAADGQIFLAPESEPMIPAKLAPHLGAILGLSNIRGLVRPHVRLAPGTGAIPLNAPRIAGSTSPRFTGSGPAGTLAPDDIKTIYGLGQTSLNGSNQTVALFELDGFSPADVASYETLFSLSNPTTLSFVGVDGTLNLCGINQNLVCNAATLAAEIAGNYNGMVEVALDIDMVIALTPGLSRIIIYDGRNSGAGVLNIFDRIATDNLAKVISTSWGGPELSLPPSFLQSESQIFQKMAAQGQTIYAAAGDNGALDNGVTIGVDDPGSQPYVTGVGGTTLGGTVQAPSETVWNTLAQTNGGATGGGVSANWPLPSYQSGVPGMSSQRFRNVPDVALNADPNTGYAIVAGGSLFKAGGTSAAAPLWAAFTALLNEQNVSAGNSVLGFANPILYQLASGSSYANLFNDVTSGDNGIFSAKAGYDNATGWGSFKGSSLISSVTGVLSLLSQGSLANVYAYPNPWDARRDSIRQITIANLPDDATVKIFTLSGFWVKTLSASNGRAVWQDLTNDAGQHVASGLYFYLATAGNNQVKGTIAIIK